MDHSKLFLGKETPSNHFSTSKETPKPLYTFVAKKDQKINHFQISPDAHQNNIHINR